MLFRQLSHLYNHKIYMRRGRLMNFTQLIIQNNTTNTCAQNVIRRGISQSNDTFCEIFDDLFSLRWAVGFKRSKLSLLNLNIVVRRTIF